MFLEESKAAGFLAGPPRVTVRSCHVTVTPHKVADGVADKTMATSTERSIHFLWIMNVRIPGVGGALVDRDPPPFAEDADGRMVKRWPDPFHDSLPERADVCRGRPGGDRRWRTSLQSEH